MDERPARGGPLKTPESEARGDVPERFARLVFEAYSPDGRYAYVVLATNEPPHTHLADTLCELDDDGWRGTVSSGAGGLMRFGDDETATVLSLIEEAPARANTAVVEWLGMEHEAPVTAGHAFFVAWNVPMEGPDPAIVRFT